MAGFESAIPPPPGVTPDPGAYVPSERNVWLAATTVMVVVPTLFIALRLAVKKADLRTWYIADYLCVAAWGLSLGMSGIAFELMKHGVGAHGWDVSTEDFLDIGKMLDNQEIIYMPAMLCTKAAIFLQLYQIFCVGKAQVRRIILIGAIATNSVFWTIMLWTTIFSCNPRAKYWDPDLPGTCLDGLTQLIATAVVNVLSYVLVLVLPVIWVWKLHMRIWRKLAICGSFGVAVLSLACSIARLVYSIVPMTSPDSTITIIPVSLWACAEVASGVVVCCIPLVPIFIRMNFGTPSQEDVEIVGIEDQAKSMRGKRGRFISDESLLLTSNAPTEAAPRSIMMRIRVEQSLRQVLQAAMYRESVCPKVPWGIRWGHR